MMNMWNSVIFVKSSKSMADMSAMAKWEGVKEIWSTMGNWDWCVQLDEKSSTPEKTEEFVNRMRQGNWATATKTNMWRRVSAK